MSCASCSGERISSIAETLASAGTGWKNPRKDLFRCQWFFRSVMRTSNICASSLKSLDIFLKSTRSSSVKRKALSPKPSTKLEFSKFKYAPPPRLPPPPPSPPSPPPPPSPPRTDVDCACVDMPPLLIMQVAKRGFRNSVNSLRFGNRKIREVALGCSERAFGLSFQS